MRLRILMLMQMTIDTHLTTESVSSLSLAVSQLVRPANKAIIFNHSGRSSPDSSIGNSLSQQKIEEQQQQ